MIYGFCMKVAGTGVQLAGLLVGLALAVLTHMIVVPLIVGIVIFVFGSYLSYVGSHTVRVAPAETVRRVLIAVAALVLSAGYGFANPVQVNRSGAGNQAQVYGDGSSATAARSAARAGASSRSRGGAGGSSAATVNVSQGISGAIGGGSARAPDVIAPGGGGMDCPTVGFGASGAGIAGGGGFGPSWISPDCNARKLAAMLIRLGRPDAALALLRSHFSEVDRVFRETEPPAPVPVKTSPAFCRTPGLVVSAYPECR